MNPIKFNDEDRRFVEEYVRKHYSYDKENGGLISLKTGRHFISYNIGSNKYYMINVWIKGKHINISIHNIVWYLCKGYWPTKEIDHINQITKDNRIENLRDVSRSENIQNKMLLWKPNKDTCLPSISKQGNRRYGFHVFGKMIKRSNKFQLFYYMILFGKRFKINCK